MILSQALLAILKPYRTWAIYLQYPAPLPEAKRCSSAALSPSAAVARQPTMRQQFRN